MNVKIIKSEKDYQAAMARLSALMSRDLKPGSTEENELELLALVIHDFERQTVPPAKADPIESILFRMDQMGLARKDLVPYIGSISKVSEVLSRKRPLSLPMIRRLHQGLDIPADSLIEDVETATSVVECEPTIDFSRFPLKEMHERGCFGDFEGSPQRLKDYAEELISKLMRGLFPKQMGPAFLRAPLHQRGDRPIVALTLRHDRIDNFWFALLHEVAHVALHLTTKAPAFIRPLWHGACAMK